MNKSLFEPIVSLVDEALCLGLCREVADKDITISQALILTFAPNTPHIAVLLIVVLTFLDICYIHFMFYLSYFMFYFSILIVSLLVVFLTIITESVSLSYMASNLLSLYAIESRPNSAAVSRAFMCV